MKIRILQIQGFKYISSKIPYNQKVEQGLVRKLFEPIRSIDIKS